MGHPEDRHLADKAMGVPVWGIGLGIPVCALLAVARHYGYVAQVPLALIFAELMFILVAMALFTSCFPPGSARGTAPAAHVSTDRHHRGDHLHARMGVDPGGGVHRSRRQHHERRRIVLRALGHRVYRRHGPRWRGGGEPGHGQEPGARPHGLRLGSPRGGRASAVVWILTFNQREKEAIEHSVVDSERRFRALVQYASDIILVVGADGAISYASPSFATTLGYSANESLGMPAHLLLEEEDVTRLSGLTRFGTESVTRGAELLMRHRVRVSALVRGHYHRPARHPRDQWVGGEPPGYLRAQSDR